MKKTIVFAGMLTSIVATAQDYDQRVGINTQTPRASLEVSATNNGKAQGVLYPYIDETEKAKWATDNDKGLVAGTMIWNTTKKCLDYFDGTIWRCTDGTKRNTHPIPWTIYSELMIASLGFNGTFKQGTALSGATVKFKLTNKTGADLNNLDLTNAVDVVNSGASITAVGQNANNISIPNGETVEITYDLSGTPNTGDLTATFTYEGQSVSATTPVASKTTAEIMQSVSVVVAKPAGTYKDGTALTNANTVSVTLTNNGTTALSNADLRNALSIDNQGANITATAGANANPVNLAPGQSITLTYTLSGTPKEGTLTANFSYEGKTASNNTTVAEIIPKLPSGMSIAEGKHTIFSMYDKNYFPYTAPAAGVAAAWTRDVNPDNTDERLIDIQGTIPATGREVKIPITYTGANTTLEAYTKEVAIDPQGEEGVTNSTRKLRLSWEKQAITSSTKFITAKITPADGQILNVTKLDLNAGFDSNYDGPKLAEFSLPKSNTDTTNKAPFAIRVIPGIPDRNFGDADKKHDFIYLPIVAEDGKIWLNNNLGAEYADYNNIRNNFNPAQQATSKDDHLAFGSLFQWQRKADGHELITWVNTGGNYNTNSTKSYSVHGPINVNWVAPANDTNFYYNTEYPYSWVSSTYNSANPALWQVNGANNPCPTGFHVPTKSEWGNLQNKIGGSHINNWWASTSALKLPSAGSRHVSDGTLGDQIDNGFYWGSTYEVVSSVSLFIIDKYRSGPTSGNQGFGLSVRCLKD